MSDAPPPLPSNEPLNLGKAPPAGKLFPCLQCGAKVEFDPRSRSLKCPYCGFKNDIDTTEDEVLERDFDEYVRKQEQTAGEVIAGRSSQVRCTGCGAMVLLEDKVVTEKCPFCSTHLENKPEHVENMIPPESLIPFGIDLRAARESFDHWLKGLWFAPTELKQIANLGQLAGVYLPYWTYDAMTYTQYHGQRGDNYTVTETYTDRDAQGNTVQRTRTVTHIRWTPVSGEVQHFFDDLLVCGSKSVPDHLVHGLEPWQLGELEAFNPEFLAGLKTERYAVDLKAGLGIAKEMMEPTIVQLIRRDIGGDHQQIAGKRTRYLAVTFKHCLLPVWVANYRYHQKLFQILINGRTGKVAGERPWSAWKIIRLVAAIVLAIGLVIALVMSLQKGGGGSSNPPPAKRVRTAWRNPSESDGVKRRRGRCSLHQ